MKKLVLLTVLVMGIATGLTFPAAVVSKQPPLGCNALPWESTPSEWDVGQKLPTFVEKQKLIDELRPGGRLYMPPKNFDKNQEYKNGEAFLGLGVKSWPYRPDTYVAVMETEMRQATGAGGYEAAYHSLYLAMLKQDGKTFSIIARTATPLQLKHDYIFNKFDFANYKISDSERAIGVQICHILSYAAAGAPTDSVAALDLVRNNGSKLEPILSTPVLLEKEPASHFESATISVSKHKTNDFYDLVKTYKGKSTVFMWQGGDYKTKEPDAFMTYLRKLELID